ncbi:sugar ABC transporter ATP-binding protein [Acholeplasma manati]|uniref:Sugar ABC transporter ATP-binding protein n=1 Tax=Paracholeplasma manati TaxID=591373 RepID=A0ABT2Y3F9_9MOLU|nr:sugar ABC transporter ATP-binding protein [Paracholeplasma manati]MCV2231267.1 sugar ABC transporter ATP-binding protein [Paracholeplasma manati]
MHEPLMKILKMSKNFGPTKALKSVDVSFYNGEIRGLVGENGSGKSTITSIISGMQRQSDGKMYFRNALWQPQSMAEAQKFGIGMVLQEASTIKNVTVAENIYAGNFDLFTKFGILDKNKMNRAASELLKKLGINHINATDMINKYNYEDCKLIEIARCMRDDLEILILDETTTAISHEGRDLVYKIMQRFKQEGKSVIFISHDINEIISQCTHLSVLRDGQIVGHLEPEDMHKNDVVQRIRTLMVGRDIGDEYYRKDYDYSCSPDVALEFNNVSVGDLKRISFQLHKGEILGFGGLNGSGMHIIARAAFGLETPDEGEVLRHGQIVKNPHDAITKDIGFISKNRDEEAVVLKASILENIVLPSLSQLKKFGFVNPLKEKKISKKEMNFYSIKARNVSQIVNTLSGGNKQKVSFAKWTSRNSEVIIMVCPTRGVDVGVKQSMYKLMYQMKKQGKSILMISEELPELIGMSDRIIIMKNNEITKEFYRSEQLSEQDIIQYMI